jgi:hypothetical protein
MTDDKKITIAGYILGTLFMAIWLVLFLQPTYRHCYSAEIIAKNNENPPFFYVRSTEVEQVFPDLTTYFDHEVGDVVEVCHTYGKLYQREYGQATVK